LAAKQGVGFVVLIDESVSAETGTETAETKAEAEIEAEAAVEAAALRMQEDWEHLLTFLVLGKRHQRHPGPIEPLGDFGWHLEVAMYLSGLDALLFLLILSLWLMKMIISHSCFSFVASVVGGSGARGGGGGR
jgi:hypothetical protein